MATATFGRSFLTKALAENYRNDLMLAARDGEAFSTATGEPLSWERSAETVYAHARAFMKLRWSDGGADNTRRSLAENLTAVVVASLDARHSKRDRPDGKVLRRAVASWALRPSSWEVDPPEEVARALAWVAAASRPMQDFAEADAIRNLLTALDTGWRGKPLKHASVQRRRAALHAMLDHAVERKLLAVNPLGGLKVRRRRVSDRIDPRQVPSLRQARRLLAAVPDGYGHLAAFYATLYYAGTRPGEARALRVDDCTLPASGWGSLLLAASRPEVPAEWTDDGDRFRERELKHRAPGDVRPVPIPPALVRILRDHIAAFGAAPDGRLFWEGAGRTPLGGQLYRRIWRRVRKAALSPEEHASVLAVRPYDLRHGCASLLLSNGVPSTEVARRLGHSVAMLHTTYAHWLENLETEANARMDAAFGDDGDKTSGHGPTAGQMPDENAG
ncbi:tyrosine-type recombinase/integrase [Actinomadura rupiterrae]|uniref:tyrosine-type recombinase/integrase n=1 Tax=Actinomadura rupiterrae TaxID=559627 RepID=UPI0020A43808|nr:site-specific integrase [Actinomadura rupiterrae]MCP2343694.1 integrase [Actinomadura rupiterrae]